MEQQPQAIQAMSSEGSQRRTVLNLDDLSIMLPRPQPMETDAGDDSQVTRRNALKSSRRAKLPSSSQQDHQDWFHRVVSAVQPINDKESLSLLLVFDDANYDGKWSPQARQDFIRLILQAAGCAYEYLDLSDYESGGPMMNSYDTKINKVRVTVEERHRSGTLILVGWGKSCIYNTVAARDVPAASILCCVNLAFSNEALNELVEMDLIDPTVPLPPSLFVIGKEANRSDETQKALREYLPNPKNGTIIVEGATEDLQQPQTSTIEQQRDAENQIANHVVDYLRRVASSSSQVPAEMKPNMGS